MPSNKPPIKPNPARWSPSSDPSSIVIPGLDTDASTADQIEQIEQLITIKLQNIDENFAKIHNVLANKLLPAVKRFAVGTEPVREAAKFWTSFYEAAAQIRIPTVDDDYSTVNEVPSEREDGESSAQDDQKTPEENTCDEENTMTRPRQDIYETSVVNSETSFLPGQGAVSSTPAMIRQPTMTMTDQSYITQGSDGPSWTPSLESPLVRLNRELNNFSNETQDDSIIPSKSIPIRSEANLPSSGSRQPVSDDYDDSSDFTFQQISKTPALSPRSDKGKGKWKEAPQPLLKNVLRHNLYSASDNSSFENNTIRLSPAKSRGKPKTPMIDKGLNPYLRGDSMINNNTTTSNTSNWSGVVDLRDPSLSTPQRKRTAKVPNAGTTTTPGNADIDDEDDSFDGLPPGMSPLRLMSPVPPPRSSAELGLLRLGPTPARDASARIQRDLLRDALQSGGVMNSARRLGTFPKYDDSTSISTLSGNSPSQSRYNLKSFKQNRSGQENNDYSTSSSNITKDSSLESMIQHIKRDIQPDVDIMPGMRSTPGLKIRPRGAGAQGPLRGQGASQNSLAPRYEETPPQQRMEHNYDSSPSEPATPIYGHHPFDRLQQGNEEIIDDGDLSSDSDSLDDEINNTAHPSAAFLMASQRRVGVDDDDDSFGSSNHSSDSLIAAEEDMRGVEGAVPIHPFEGVVVEDRFDDEDSFDDDGPGTHGREEETVFGAQPYARSGRLAPEANQLRMLGEELDTMAIESRFAGVRGLKVADTPTPASRPT